MARKAEKDQPGSPKEPTPDHMAKLVEKLDKGGEPAAPPPKRAGKIGKEANDKAMREVAKEILEKNNRDPATGKEIEAKPARKTDTKPGTEKKKGDNTFGFAGKSPGIGDDVKAAAANREFARKIGQMQLDDWKKRMTPAMLKKAGMTDAEWQQFLKNMQTYDALVRQLNAQLAKAQMREKRGTRPSTAGTSVLIEGPTTSDGPLDSFRALPPPDLRDAQRRFSTRKAEP